MIRLDIDLNSIEIVIFAFVMLVVLIVGYVLIEVISEEAAEFISNKIVIPYVVGVLLGGASYLITGDFAIGGGIAIFGSLISVFISNQ